MCELNVRLPGDIFHTDPFYAGVLSPRAGYRTMKMAGSAINRTIEQTKAAISMLAPPVSGHGSRLSKTGFLTYDTRASGPKFNRGAGRTTGVFCTLKARSPVCRGRCEADRRGGVV